MDAEFIIIGTGPAGISAAWPLVEAGRRVMLIDGGRVGPPAQPSERPNLAAMRRVGDPRWLLGERLAGLRSVGDLSPKLRTAGQPDLVAGYRRANQLETKNFQAIGTLVHGGLSTIWGAVACELPVEKMADWPKEAREEMPVSYARVGGRMGLSGDPADAVRLGLGRGVALQPPLPLSALASALLKTGTKAEAKMRADNGLGLELGRPVSAVLTKPKDGRMPCSADRACMWGCARGAVWSAADDLSDLRHRANVDFRPGLSVERIHRDGAAWCVAARDQATNKLVTLRAARVLLAAGALASTRLALAAACRFDEWLPVSNAPTQGFAMVLPRRLGQPQPETGYGNAQLCFRLAAGNHGAFGLLYDGDVMAAADVMARMPLSRPGAAASARSLMPGLMLGLLYLPGYLSRNRLRLERRNSGDCVLVVEGGEAPELTAVRKQAAAQLRKQFGRLGGWILPGSTKSLVPGAEVHVGASLPMGGETDELGQLTALPGLHVVDGAVLPAIPAESHTMTIMANADRIGTALAQLH